MSFFDGLDTEKYDRQYSDKVLFQRIVGYFRPEVGRLTWIGITIIIISAVGALQPVIVSETVDRVQSDNTLSTILWLSGLILLSGVISWGANWVRRRLTTRAVANVIINLAKQAFEMSAQQDLSFHDEFSSGKIASRITSDTRDFGQLVTISTDVINQIVEAGILGVVLFRIEWRLFLLVIALLPIVFILTISYRRMARTVTRQGMQAMANVNSEIKETTSGIAVAKNFRQESSIYDVFNKANQTSYQVNLKRGLVLSIVFPTLNALGGVATALLVYVGGLSASQGMVTVGSWYLFLLSLDRFLFPILNLSSYWTQIQGGLSAAERVFALIDSEPSVKQTNNQHVASLKGDIEFEHIGFQYKTNEIVLTDFTLHIHAGETVALVGHTGAGKSSIAKLIARYYEFQMGELRVDGQDIRSLELPSYRRNLGIVSQTPFLFSGSVLDNIRYGCPSILDDEIMQISRQIGGGEWVDSLPNGLFSEVGERGAFLSMGQRQLVSLMRVLIQKPGIFILDEATASIDPFTEWQIQQALNLILSRTTSILIAHRLSTVKSADRILVMEKGKIIEEGNHDGLLEMGGQYATLYNTYFRHQSIEYLNIHPEDRYFQNVEKAE